MVKFRGPAVDLKWFMTKVPKDAFLKQMWPLLAMYRLLCRFPFRRRKDGIMELKLFSFATIYFLVGFVGQTYLVLHNAHGIFMMMFSDGTDFADVVTGGLNICLLAIHLFVPFSMIKEWKLLCEVFNKWAKFQDRYREVMKEYYEAKLFWWVIFVAASIPLGAFSVIILNRSILYHEEWYHLLAYVFVLMPMVTLYAIWIFLLGEIITVADKIRHRTYEIIDSTDIVDKSLELYNLRILWNDLSILVNFSSTAVACSMIFISATGVVIFIASAYGFMQCVALGDERYFLFMNILLVMALVLGVPCEFGYRASLHAGTYILEMLSSVNVTEQDELSAREVDLFLQTVYANYPHVSYGGMVKINRETITSLLSATLTYLIVLLQLRVKKSPEPTNPTTVSVENNSFVNETLSSIKRAIIF